MPSPQRTEIPEPWLERLSDLPAKWFDELPCSPSRVPLSAWPFDASERAELEKDPALKEAVSEVLRSRAEIRWLDAPRPEEIGEWLSGGADPELEADLRRVALARESARQQAWLRVGAGLLAREQAEAKLAAIGALPAARRLWHSVKMATARVQRSLAEAGAEMAAAFQAGQLASARHRDPAAEQHTIADLAARLGADGRLTVFLESGILVFELKDDVLTLAAGHSSMEMLAEFALEFRREGMAYLRLEAVEGKVTLTPVAITAPAEADEIAITTPA